MKQICLYHEYCGACTMQGLSYAEQLEKKQDKVNRLFQKIHTVNPIIGADNPYHYRNKAQITFGYDDDHHIIAGNYIESTHIIVPIEECQLVYPKANAIFKTIIKLVRKYHLSIFDEQRLSGCLRHVLIRNSSDGKQIMVVFVTGTEYFPKKKELLKELTGRYPEIVSIIQNINRRRTSMILGNRSFTLYGKDHIVDELCGCRFKISSSSFYQINHAQTEKLYRHAIEKAEIAKNDTVFDAYCGIGTIGIIAASKAGKVIGVELNRQAVKDAISNAKENGIRNIRFYQEDAGSFMDHCQEEIDVLIMDPPRSGSDHKFLSAVSRLSPGRIVYISCEPETQVRDLKYLLRKNYKIMDVQPFDLFPFTDHCELIALLERNK
ncbi:MAG: 23S rRNA (uracil(1939)-C(5))-methyltransferase RlmD [Erysipelotrichaceae bacterium]|nr:23S rRNA (uracil(1939)-C(5))-methyltransferase RlmD [Erysipelotrichaceae bacterium]